MLQINDVFCFKLNTQVVCGTVKEIRDGMVWTHQSDTPLSFAMLTQMGSLTVVGAGEPFYFVLAINDGYEPLYYVDTLFDDYSSACETAHKASSDLDMGVWKGEFPMEGIHPPYVIYHDSIPYYGQVSVNDIRRYIDQRGIHFYVDGRVKMIEKDSQHVIKAIFQRHDGEWMAVLDGHTVLISQTTVVEIPSHIREISESRAVCPPFSIETDEGEWAGTWDTIVEAKEYAKQRHQETGVVVHINNGYNNTCYTVGEDD